MCIDLDKMCFVYVFGTVLFHGMVMRCILVWHGSWVLLAYTFIDYLFIFLLPVLSTATLLHALLYNLTICQFVSLVVDCLCLVGGLGCYGWRNNSEAASGMQSWRVCPVSE